MTRRVVVTGGAVVTALGCELSEFWDGLCAGKSGVGPLKRFDTCDFKVKFGGEVSTFNPSDFLDIDARDVRRLDRFCQFTVVAAHKAVLHSGIDFAQGEMAEHDGEHAPQHGQRGPTEHAERQAGDGVGRVSRRRR